MRVAVFFDGKNFYAAQKSHGVRGRIDFIALSNWLVTRVRGTVLTGCHYYTGIEQSAATSGQGGRSIHGADPLINFLEMLENQPGYFVYKFPRKVRSFDCEHCAKPNIFTQEKEVDTKMVADMLRLAAVNAFDIAILISGDADHAPAVEGLRDLGKLVYVGTWGSTGLAKRIRRAAFDHINLIEGLHFFHHADTMVEIDVPLDSSTAGTAPDMDTEDHNSQSEELNRRLDEPDEVSNNEHTGGESLNDQDEAFLEALQAAIDKFKPNGYVGVSYFLERWTHPGFDRDRAVRQASLTKLKKLGVVEIAHIKKENTTSKRLLLTDSYKRK